MVGDFLHTAQPDQSSMVPDEVVSAQSVVMDAGVFAPLTSSGTIVVDGIVASCYGSFYSHSLVHSAMAPLRLVHGADAFFRNAIADMALGDCGIHWYARALLKVANIVPYYPSMWW